VYGNCQKYIQAREWQAQVGPAKTLPRVSTADTLTADQQQWIATADTFFIASAHDDGGADASHRGGTPGFVQVLSARRLVWPDYSGNNMFQTLGNLTVNPHAGLLFIDFAHGRTLQLTGTAVLQWEESRVAQYAGAERLVEFELTQAVEITGGHSLRWRFIAPSPFNPA
jgi:uncharacterized protein